MVRVVKDLSYRKNKNTVFLFGKQSFLKDHFQKTSALSAFIMYLNDRVMLLKSVTLFSMGIA